MALRLVAGSDTEIGHGFERAMYLPQPDEIRLPWPRRFSGPEAYCATGALEWAPGTTEPAFRAALR